MKTSDPAHEMTDIEKQFIVGYKEIVGRAPGDWTTERVRSGTSSFLSYRGLLRSHGSSLDLLLSCVENINNRNRCRGYPAFRDVEREYKYRSGKTVRPSDARHQTCEICHGSGIVIVATLARRGKTYLLRSPTRLGPGEQVIENSSACKCSAGQRQAVKWFGGAEGGAMPQDMIARLWSARLEPSQFYALRDDSARLSGREVKDLRVHIPLPHSEQAAADMLAADDDRRDANMAQYTDEDFDELSF